MTWSNCRRGRFSALGRVSACKAGESDAEGMGCEEADVLGEWCGDVWGEECLIEKLAPFEDGWCCKGHSDGEHTSVCDTWGLWRGIAGLSAANMH